MGAEYIRPACVFAPERSARPMKEALMNVEVLYTAWAQHRVHTQGET